MLLELFPFGRHALTFELGPLLLAVADDRGRRGAAAPRVAVSLRDVLVSKPNQAWAELASVAVARQWTDRVLVHGSPDVIPLDRTLALADRLGDRLVYTGYLGPDGAGAGRAAARRGRRSRRAAARSAAPLPRGARGVAADDRRAGAAVAARDGALSPGRRPRASSTGRPRRLPTRAGRPAVVVEAYRPDLGAHLGGAALSVSQAGYNTVLELVAHRVRAVVVPYEGSGDEQPLRAGLLAERGLLEIVPEAELTPARLAAAMDAALERPGFPAPVRLDLERRRPVGRDPGRAGGGVRAARAQGDRRCS